MSKWSDHSKAEGSHDCAKVSVMDDQRQAPVESSVSDSSLRVLLPVNVLTHTLRSSGRRGRGAGTNKCTRGHWCLEEVLPGVSTKAAEDANVLRVTRKRTCA